MTDRLIVHINETWPEQPSAPWVLLNDRDQVLQEGRSEPAHWPAARECEVVLGGAQCSWLETHIPKAARREQERLLRYALESQLLKDIEAQHLTVTHQETDGEHLTAGVLVTSRMRLRHVLAQFKAIGRPPARVVSELQAAPHAGSRWVLALGPGGDCILRTDARHALVVDLPGAAEIVAHALQQTRAQGIEPEALEVELASGVPGFELEPFEEAIGLKTEQGAAYRWWSGLGSCADLLHDEFEGSHGGSRVFAGLRAPLILAGASLALFLVINVANVLWQGHQLGAIEERMRRLFTTAVPNTPAIAPALQLRRHLAEARSRNGLLRDDDLLGLLYAYTEIRGSSARASIRKLDYADGRLALTLDPASVNELSALTDRFAALGYDARVEPEAPDSLVISRKDQP